MALSSPGNPWRYPKGDPLGRGGRFAPKGTQGAEEIRTPQEEYDMRNIEKMDYTEEELYSFHDDGYVDDKPSPEGRAALYRLHKEAVIGREANTYSAKDIKTDRKGNQYLEFGKYSDVREDYAYYLLKENGYTACGVGEDPVAEEGDLVRMWMTVEYNKSTRTYEPMIHGEYRITDSEGETDYMELEAPYDADYAETKYIARIFKDAKEAEK